MRPFPAVDAAHWKISTNGGTRPLWARSGTELFYLDGTNSADPRPDSGDPDVQRRHPRRRCSTRSTTPLATVGTYDVSPDGQRFLMIKDNRGTDQAPDMVVVLNWLEELKAKLPAK